MKLSNFVLQVIVKQWLNLACLCYSKNRLFEPRQQIKFLGGIVSILSLLGISLFFAGWIYRWAYYGYFKIELTQLDLPPQSFLLVPLQIFLGSLTNILKTAIIFSLVPLLVYLTLWLLRLIGVIIQFLTKLFKIGTFWKRVSKPNLTISESFQFLQTLVDELVIVTWVLLIIFWLARNQGTIDAKRDAINETSTLPIVTFISTQKSLILGTDLTYIDNQTADDPPITNNLMIGDVDLAKIIRTQSLNNRSEQRVWRLLAERNGWIFLFHTLSTQAKLEERPLVLVIPKGSEQLMILSPNVPQ